MRQRNYFIVLLLFISTLAKAELFDLAPEESNTRAYFVHMLTTIADPVLQKLSEDKLKAEMPVEVTANPWGDRSQVTYLEAFGRTLVGIAPWLELGPDESKEGKLRGKYMRQII